MRTASGPQVPRSVTRVCAVVGISTVAVARPAGTLPVVTTVPVATGRTVLLFSYTKGCALPCQESQGPAGADLDGFLASLGLGSRLYLTLQPASVLARAADRSKWGLRVGFEPRSRFELARPWLCLAPAWLGARFELVPRAGVGLVSGSPRARPRARPALSGEGGHICGGRTLFSVRDSFFRRGNALSRRHGDYSLRSRANRGPKSRR